jgi:hypothetical protein
MRPMPPDEEERLPVCYLCARETHPRRVWRYSGIVVCRACREYHALRDPEPQPDPRPAPSPFLGVPVTP